MNERIKELAVQAKLPDYLLEYGTELCVAPHLQRFAELIIKDCMAMSDELKAQYLTSRKSTMDFDEKNIYAEGEAACDILKYKMKRHFGVEE